MTTPVARPEDRLVVLAHASGASVPVVVASIRPAEAPPRGPLPPPANSDPLQSVPAPGQLTPTVVPPAVVSRDLGPLVLTLTPTLSATALPAPAVAPADFGPLVLAPARRLSAPVLTALAATDMDSDPLRPAPAPAPAPSRSAPVLVASTSTRTNYGQLGPGARADFEPSGPIPAPTPSAAGGVVLAAAPRAGRGESALIGVAPTSAPAQQNTPNKSALVLAAGPVTQQDEELVPTAGAAAADWGAMPGMSSGPWAVPPVRWTGYMAMDLRVTGVQGQPRQTQLVESVNLSGSSYIWQPWFAQVVGDVSLLASQQPDSVGGVATTAGGGINATTLTGSGQLSLIPISRFPFTAAFKASDSRTDNQLTSNPFTTRNYTLTQSYAPLEGGSSYQVTYNHNDVISAASGTDTAKALGASMNWSSGSNSVSIIGTAYSNLAGKSGNSSSNKTFTADHSYRPDSEVSITSQASVHSNQYNYINMSQLSALRFRYRQAYSNATWQPAGKPDLTVTGGARLYQNEVDINGASGSTRIFSVNAAATYKLNTNTTLIGSGVITHAGYGDESSVYTSQTAGIGYAADTIQFGEYSYNWNAGANVGNQTGGESSARNIDAHVGHRVDRNFALGNDSNLAINASQSYSTVRSTLFPTSQSLLHNAGASWSKKLSEAATTSVSLNASDSRTTGYTDQRFQLVSANAGGQLTINRQSSASGYLVLQASRQTMSSAFPTGTANTTGGGFDTSISGNLTYQHGRAFGVPQLRYYALLNLFDRNARTRLQGNIDAPVERPTWDIEQRLDYDIGRLSTRLTVHFGELGGKANNAIYFRVMRQFGAL